MPLEIIDGIETNYETIGVGPPVLFFSPGGFDATLEKWSKLGVYERIKLLSYLPKKHQCIIFDRRETGSSGGRVEQITWDHYVQQGKGLLEHLGIEKSHLLGGCMGCCPATTFAVKYPSAVISMILFWPVGGAHYRIRAQARFSKHLSFVKKEGLEGVVTLAKSTDVGFGKDPRIGPWGPVIRRDPVFASNYCSISIEIYQKIIIGMQANLINCDTAPGASAEELIKLDIPTLIVPGKDIAHATSAARYLEECLPLAQYWDIHPDLLSEANAPARLIEFLDESSVLI
ncbi:MAG: alpha/beta hydrolase [Gammaproteobacteria bacterium]|nr:alpha/beta hydrolase [Gammaproteobacteria bacterium]